MFRFARIALAATLPLLAISEAAVAAGPAQAARGHALSSFKTLPVGNYALAPFAFIRFCVDNPDDCRAGQKPTRVSWTGASRSLVAKVNSRVNRTMIPRNDTVESWNADTAAGDCEDYALTKRRALIRLGVPASALRIATARTANRVGHAVLVVNTTAGDMVLDNRTNSIRLWKNTDLDFIRIASAENPRIWKAVVKR